jgi:large subunit ribosomal protein L17
VVLGPLTPHPSPLTTYHSTNMRHLKAGRKLGRNATHRLALMRNLARGLIEHERIITTVEKAKEARRFVEKLITIAKKAALTDDEPRRLHLRRQAIAKMGPVAKIDLYDKENPPEPTGDTLLEKLFNDIGPRFKNRAGGYTRIIRRHERRLGDAGQTAFLELLKEGEKKVRAKAAPSAPAPKVTKEEVEEEEEEEK